MSRPDDMDRVRSVLGRPELSRLVRAMRRRLELGRRLVGRLTLTDVTEDERSAIDALAGRRPTSGRLLSVDLGVLEENLARSGLRVSMAEAVVALTGDVENRTETAARREEAWGSVWAEFESVPRTDGRLASWWEGLRTTGLVRRLSGDDPSGARRLLRDLLRLREALPGNGEPLAALAARLFGSAHALDPGTPLATLAVRLAARFGTVTFEDDAEGRRTAWAGAGVLCDELSTPVLVYQLTTTLENPLGRLLRCAADAAEPIHLSLRWLLRHGLAGDPSWLGRSVFCCENPTVVALAARHIGRRCAPLICVGGQFATPALVMLRQLGEAGARVRYHGDFDPAGIAIARRAMAVSGGEPWRYGAEDYLAAPKGEVFTGTMESTPWSPELAEAMGGVGRVVHEEVVFDTLAVELAAGSG